MSFLQMITKDAPENTPLDHRVQPQGQGELCSTAPHTSEHPMVEGMGGVPSAVSNRNEPLPNASEHPYL